MAEGYIPYYLLYDLNLDPTERSFYHVWAVGEKKVYRFANLQTPTCIYSEFCPDWHDLIGDCEPDARGCYCYDGEYDSFPYYRFGPVHSGDYDPEMDEPCFLWFHQATASWIINREVGSLVGGYFSRAGAIVGTYTPNAPYTGSPVIIHH